MSTDTQERATANVDPAKLAKFAALAHQWWDLMNCSKHRYPVIFWGYRSGDMNTSKSRIMEGLLSEVEKPHLRMFLYTFLLDTPVEFAKVITKRFFPGIGEIRLRYGLPPGSKKAYAYYLMNPILVLFKRP